MTTTTKTTIFNNLQDALRGSDAMNEELYKHLMANKDKFEYEGEDYSPIHDCLTEDGARDIVHDCYDGFYLNDKFTGWHHYSEDIWFHYAPHTVFYCSMDNWVHTDNGDGTFHVKRMRTHRIVAECLTASCDNPEDDEVYDDTDWYAFEWVECIAEGDAPVNALEYIGAFYSPGQNIRYMPNFIVDRVAEHAMDAINYWHCSWNEEMVKRVLEACRVAVQLREHDEPRKTCMLSVEQLAKLAKDYEEVPQFLQLVEAMRNDVEEFNAKHARLVSYAASCREHADENEAEAQAFPKGEYDYNIRQAIASESREEADECERQARRMKPYVRAV